MIPAVPASVWEQIGVVVIFAFLLGGLGYGVYKVFSKSLSDLTAQFGRIIEDTNSKWRDYFDARSTAANLLSEQMIGRLDAVTKLLESLYDDFHAHDQMERQALDEMAGKRNLSNTQPVRKIIGKDKQ